MEKLKELVKSVNGSKSYAVGVITAAYVLLQSFNVINTTPEQDVAVYALLASVFGMSIRHAIAKK